MTVHVRVTGLDDIRRLLRANDRKVRAATGRAITAEVVELGRRADELVPFDTGNLMRSQVIKLPDPKGRSIVGTVEYGGSAAPYALRQHEDLELWHPPKPPGKSKVGKRQGTGPVAPGQGRGPKFLEHPFKRQQKLFSARLAARVNRDLRLGGR
jgi:hypothetical protein